MTDNNCAVWYGVVSFVIIAVVGASNAIKLLKGLKINRERSPNVYWRTLHIIRFIAFLRNKPIPMELNAKDMHDLGYWGIGVSFALIALAIFLMIRYIE